MEWNWSQTLNWYQWKSPKEKLTWTGNEISLRKGVRKGILGCKEKASLGANGNWTTKTQKDYLLLMLLWWSSLWQKWVYWYIFQRPNAKHHGEDIKNLRKNKHWGIYVKEAQSRIIKRTIPSGKEKDKRKWKNSSWITNQWGRKLRGWGWSVFHGWWGLLIMCFINFSKMFWKNCGKQTNNIRNLIEVFESFTEKIKMYIFVCDLNIYFFILLFKEDLYWERKRLEMLDFICDSEKSTL